MMLGCFQLARRYEDSSPPLIEPFDWSCDTNEDKEKDVVNMVMDATDIYTTQYSPNGKNL